MAASVAPVEKETKVTFTTPLDPTRLGMDAFNLFIAVSKNFDATYRGREVHLMTFDATDLIDPNLLKYDPTNPQDWKSDDNPYRLRNGLVWAIMIPTEFRWARETIDVASIYTNYINWYSTAAADAQYWYDTSVSTNVSNYNWLYN
jgi:LruC domain-containing protein